MATAKKEPIVLISIQKEKGKDGKSSKERKVTIEHANNLMRLQAEKKRKNGWKIIDKKYIFKNNEIQKRPDSK